MKNITLFSFVLVSIFMMRCDKSETVERIEGVWHVIKISGGIVGKDCTYEKGDYVWTFEGDQLIRVSKAVFMNEDCERVESDRQEEFEIISENDKEYLQIDDNPYGQLTINTDSISINTNKLPEGEGADGFSYLLIRD